MMVCNAHAIHSWTFTGLVGGFLDLSLAYLLLCGSTLAFFATKFLSIFNLYLPCPCTNGLFNDPNLCVKSLLVDCPTNLVSSVHMSIKTKFPFDSIGIIKDDQQQQQRRRRLNLKLVKQRDFSNSNSSNGGDYYCEGFLEIEGEAAAASSCSSVSDARAPPPPNSKLLLSSSNGEGKGKAVISNYRSRSGSVFLRRRRRAASNHGKLSSVSSSDPPPRLMGSQVNAQSYGGISQIGQEIKEEEEDDEKEGLQHAQNGVDLLEASQSSLQMTELMGETENMDKDALSAGESMFGSHKEVGVDGNETHSIRMLEQALEEEHAARNALYLELEEERSAAATAADEAMAMILRLQEEKASIEMEARQYQRMIEEKSAYDAEEMNILKEILLRREMEKHFLEKEVEAYRKNMLIGEEQLEGDSHYMVGISEERMQSFDPSEDPGYMLQKISESISKKETDNNVKMNFDYDTLSFDDWNEDANFLRREETQRSLNLEKHHPHVSKSMNESRQGLQEKGMVLMDQHLSSSEHNGLMSDADSGLLELNGAQQLHEKAIIFLDGDRRLENNARLCQGLVSETDQTHNGVEINFPCDVSYMEKHEKDSYQGGRVPQTSTFETEQSIYDVHVIDDESKLCNQGNGKESDHLSVPCGSDKMEKCTLPFEASGSRRDRVIRDHPSTSRVETETDIRRSKSDISPTLPMMEKLQDKAPVFDSRRGSISSVDRERSKLEIEVEWLRERLRIVQEGREKLSFSVDPREREQMQLQLLEAIANQLQEIRQLTEPGKAVRQASLPPASSKVSSKKRRYRGVPWGVHGSS